LILLSSPLGWRCWMSGRFSIPTRRSRRITTTTAPTAHWNGNRMTLTRRYKTTQHNTMDSHYFRVLWNVWPQFPKAVESEFKTLAQGEREREMRILQSSQERGFSLTSLTLYM
jgi:hypothetical protein